MATSGNTENTLKPEATPLPEHPSDYQLDQLYLGELRADTNAAVREHLTGCLHCKKRQELRDDGMSAFPEVDAGALLERIQLAVVSQVQSNPAHHPVKRRTQFLAFLMPSVLVAAALLLFFGLREDRQVETGAEIRAKGGLALRVFRQNLPMAEELLSGQDLTKGDTIRFVVDLPTELASQGALQAMLLSVEEQGGKQSVYFPSGEESSATLVLDEEGALPVATKLDSYLGMETLLLVVCPQPFALEELTITLDSQGVSHIVNSAAGCHQSRFRMHKQG